MFVDSPAQGKWKQRRFSFPISITFTTRLHQSRIEAKKDILFQVQLLGYNRDLYANFSEAMTKPAGLVGVSVMIDLINPTYSPDTSNVELKKITNAIRKIRFRGWNSSANCPVLL